MPETVVRPIDDVITTGFTHDGGGEFWEDVDESPDAPDSNEVHWFGSGDYTLRFKLSETGFTNVESVLCRIKYQGSNALLQSLSIFGTSGVQFVMSFGSENPLGATVEYELYPIMAVPEDMVGPIYGQLTVAAFAGSPTFDLSAIEFVVTTTEEGGGGGGGNPPGPGGQLSQNASWFQQTCGL